jgi:hypothetical protein
MTGLDLSMEEQILVHIMIGFPMMHQETKNKWLFYFNINNNKNNEQH